MAITASDITFNLATTAGAAGDSTAQADPNASLGKYISTTQLTDATLLNLFDKIGGDENAASTVDYRLFFVKNTHATITWENVVAWISAETAGGASVAISADTTGVTAKGSSSAQAKTIASETTAPATQSFSAPTTKGAGISLGNIPPGSVAAIWVRRTAANSAALDVDGAVIRCEGDTSA
jgi:hypothetical protein